MSKYIDGSDEPATYGQALVWLAENASYGDAVLKAEIVGAIQKEHNLVPPKPVPVYADPRDQTLNAQEKRLAELEGQLAARAAEDKAAADAKRIADLEAQLAGQADVPPEKSAKAKA